MLDIYHQIDKYNCFGNESQLVHCGTQASTTCESQYTKNSFDNITLHCKGDPGEPNVFLLVCDHAALIKFSLKYATE